MILMKADLEEHYQDMRKELFFAEDVQDLEGFLDLFLEKGTRKKKLAAKKAIAFEYHDEKELIDASDPDRTRIILAIAAFLIKNDFSFDLLTESMYHDLKSVLNDNKVEKYKRFYHAKDFELMKKAAVAVRRRLEG